MSKIIFSKYSNERADRFCIRTDIWQDQNGNRWVEKRPMHPKAKKHVQGIAGTFEALSESLRDSGLGVNRCQWDADRDVLKLEYLEGATLEEELDKMLAEHNPDGICERMGQYFSILRNRTKTVPFAGTDAFREVFADPAGLEGMEAFLVSDIDMIFSNILVGKEGETLIDYEWTFAFPVPVNYVIYRCLYYYIQGNAKRLVLKERNLYEKFGISREQKKTFAGMEEAFQSYMLGGHTPIRLLYDAVSPGYTEMKPVIRGIFDEHKKRRVQVFYDFGSGFQEKDSSWHPAGTGVVKLAIPVPKGARGMRIDPCCGSCVLWVKGIRSGGKSLSYSTNGVRTGKDVFLFETDDPQLLLSGITGEMTEAEIEFQVSFPEKLELEALRTLQNQLENSREQIRQMEGTRAWKLNEKFRKLRKRD